MIKRKGVEVKTRINGQEVVAEISQLAAQLCDEVCMSHEEYVRIHAFCTRTGTPIRDVITSPESYNLGGGEGLNKNAA